VVQSNDFMEVVFNQLKNAEVGVSANADKSVYYVVQVKNRTPVDTAGEMALKQEFMKDNILSSRENRHLTDIESAQLYAKWTEQFEQAHGVQWQRDASGQ